MRVSSEHKKFERLVHKLDPQSRLMRVWELEGGVSAQVTGLEVERDNGRTEKMIVRQHGEADLKNNPQVAADEFRLLRLLRSLGLTVPEAYFLDQSGEIFATPYIVIEYIEGKPELAPSSLRDYILQFATHLSEIHRVDYSKLDVSFLPLAAERFAGKLRERPAKLDDAGDEGRIRDVLETVWSPAQRNTDVLLHGDFWPGNLLWRDERMVGIIDWEDAAWGDPLSDVANSRLELLWAFGSEAMHDFTRRYQAITSIDFTNLPYWDLCAALRLSGFAAWYADELAEKNARERYGWFVGQALKRL